MMMALLAACSSPKNSSQKNMQNNNPFFQKSSLQYQAPHFDKITNAHFAPAINAGIVEQSKEYEAIAADLSPATFKNTIYAIETSGELLGRVMNVFYNYTSANTNETLQQLEEKYAPILSAHADALYLNDKIFQRVKAVYNNRMNEKLDAEDLRLTEFLFQKFEMRGANLSPEQKESLKSLNSRMATLEAMYTKKLLDARKNATVLVDDVKLLDGLTADEIAATAAAATKSGKTGYLLSITNTTQQPQYSGIKNRNLRERLFNASWTRAEMGDSSDTRSIIEELAKLRLQKAKLLGKPNYAAWKLQDQMAKDPRAARSLLEKLASPAVAKAKTELADIQSLINQQGGNFTAQPWDWNFYSDQVRKAKYDLDEAEIKPYFEVNNVLERGVFYAAEKFYGITFKKRPDLPVYHPDVVAYEVFDADGKSMAIYYLDFYARDNKSGGAWMSNYVEQSHVLGQKPVIVNVFNYPKPAPGKPSLISFDDVETMFHEFGHTLHGLFANQKYVSLSGTNTPRDFVELPSQVNEMWALYPDVLKNYAVHYATGAPMPASLIDKIKKAATFNVGYMTTELAEAALVDLEWHTIEKEGEVIAANEFEKAALVRTGFTLPQVPPRYHSPYFLHIWANGYSSGYYAYVWSQNLDANTREWILKNGGLTRANGDKVRKYILSVGNTVDLNQQFESLIGKKPEIDALLRLKGLN